MKATSAWKVKNAPSELRGVARLFAKMAGTQHGDDVRLEPVSEPGLCEVSRANGMATIRYGAPSLAARGLGALLSGLVQPGETYRESTPFRSLGVMLDCSRNAVMTASHVCDVWLPRLALLGYNTLMLYTEETYELPGEPFFGYMRGAYTESELKAVVKAASALNIEVIPCIQTLGHLEHLLKHPAYRQVRDTSSVLMVGEPATYELIEKMVKHWRGICRSGRIHVGMDETHDLGRGRYLDKHGYRPGFDLFNEHLTHVVKICRKYGMEPMIWSDMYFRLGCESGEYYDPKTTIPKSVIRKIPAEVELVYWDYYHDNVAFYLDWIARHRALGREPLMASGIWTWNRYWYDYRHTEANAGACVRACYQAGLKELIFTMWGDNGAYCDHDSAFAGMTYCADIAFGTETPDTERLSQRFAAICGGDYRAHRLAGDLHGDYRTHKLPGKARAEVKNFQPDLWGDPFFEKALRTWAADDPRKMRHVVTHYRQLADQLKPHVQDRSTGDMEHAFNLARVFGERYALITDLLVAYQKRDRLALRQVQLRIPEVIAAVQAVATSFRNMWMRHNKPAGLEVIQGRFGMLEVRYQEMGRRIQDLLDGTIERLAELDCDCSCRAV